MCAHASPITMSLRSLSRTTSFKYRVLSDNVCLRLEILAAKYCWTTCSQTQMAGERNKIIVVGPAGAGKTTFFNRCTKSDFVFNENNPSTEFSDERSVTREVDGRSIRFNMVDTVGTAVFGETVTVGHIFRGCRMVLCLFDVSSLLSFQQFLNKDRFENIKAQIELRQGSISQVDFLMIGAQNDKEPKITDYQVEDLVNNLTTNDRAAIHYFRLDRKYFTCSAKAKQGIDEILNFIAQTLANDTPGERETSTNTISLHIDNVSDDGTIIEKKKKKKLDCCNTA